MYCFYVDILKLFKGWSSCVVDLGGNDFISLRPISIHMNWVTYSKCDVYTDRAFIIRADSRLEQSYSACKLVLHLCGLWKSLDFCCNGFAGFVLQEDKDKIRALQVEVKEAKDKAAKAGPSLEDVSKFGLRY